MEKRHKTVNYFNLNLKRTVLDVGNILKHKKG
ncbi:unnamed protein product [Chironomus riparius]|uniref:Uncharacterized protein n=1 Tax=Chironomus riparius TaxID=315576 RepID=A0A9N9RI59_9DIPT|nr:unnamed protein product [Chironomus riparius]